MWRRRRSYSKLSHKMMSGVASRPGGLVWSDVWLPMEITSKVDRMCPQLCLIIFVFLISLFCTMTNKCTIN